MVLALAGATEFATAIAANDSVSIVQALRGLKRRYRRTLRNPKPHVPTLRRASTNLANHNKVSRLVLPMAWTPFSHAYIGEEVSKVGVTTK